MSRPWMEFLSIELCTIALDSNSTDPTFPTVSKANIVYYNFWNPFKICKIFDFIKSCSEDITQ